MKLQRLTLISALVAGVLAAGSGFAATMGDMAMSPDDTMLIDQVRAAFMRSDLQAPNLTLKVEAGHVQLQGWVQYPRDLETARHAAALVPGVKRVDSLVRTWASDDLN